MSMNQSDVDRLRRAVAAALREHWMLFVVEGIVLLVLGAAAIIIPQIATLAVALLLGWLFFISGVVGPIAPYLLRHAPGFLVARLGRARHRCRRCFDRMAGKRRVVAHADPHPLLS